MFDTLSAPVHSIEAVMLGLLQLDLSFTQKNAELYTDRPNLIYCISFNWMHCIFPGSWTLHGFMLIALVWKLGIAGSA